ncbi:hypothetical protein MF628_000945 [Paenibacillus polymyxa]|uniref:BC1872 family protein n=1 Tax=Paenibacillus polymyxa TaxID=1406 RepID=UPI002024F328|nr:hypothetical protein [Paenibacillus polymyxa]URJ46415.3 hypothetical protein MF628_000945 [Paenibacillus polymyxa]
MQPRERDAWIAVDVMGKKKSVFLEGWISTGDFEHCPKPYTTDIGTAWEVAQRYPIMTLTRTQIFEISPAEYSCTFWSDADSSPIEVPATTAQEAVCLAALISVLTQGEGIEE